MTSLGLKQPHRSISADGLEKLLAWLALALLSAVIIALMKGQPEWSRLPLLVWLHLATIITALVITPVMFLRQRGDQPHRYLGRIWVAAMVATAILSFFVRSTYTSGWSPIHILSALVLVQAPRIYWTARTHQIAKHRRAVRAMVIGALLTAGFFTFPFDRQLGQWLFS